MLTKINRKIKRTYKLWKHAIVGFFVGRYAIKFPASVKIQTPHQTIIDVEFAIRNKIRGAYLRFGDGDVNLLCGIDDLLQEATPAFAREMKETFELTGAGVFKCLPIHSEKFGKEPLMKAGFHSAPDYWAEEILRRCFEYFIGEKIYSHVALSHIATVEQDYAIQFIKLIKEHRPIFVGNKDVPENVLKNVLNSNERVSSEKAYSYRDIDRIEKETLAAIENRSEDFILLVVAMGCAGRVLEKRILKATSKNVFLFDFGSLLDLLSGWETRAWMSEDLSTKDGEYWKDFISKL